MFFYELCFLTVDLECKTGITGVPFGRTELSLRLSWIEFGPLASRGGPEGPWFQGMPEKSFVHDFTGGHFSTNKTWKTSEIFCCGAMGWAREARGPGPLGQGARAPRPSAPPGPSPSRNFIYFHVFVYHFSIFVDLVFVFRLFFLKNKCMKMVDEHGWILEFRAENDTKWSA